MNTEKAKNFIYITQDHWSFPYMSMSLDNDSHIEAAALITRSGAAAARSDLKQTAPDRNHTENGVRSFGLKTDTLKL